MVNNKVSEWKHTHDTFIYAFIFMYTDARSVYDVNDLELDMDRQQGTGKGR